MMRSALALLLVCTAFAAYSQGRKMPNVSFQEHSAEYANANRAYNELDEYTDTLHDARIIIALAQILEENPDLVVEIGGHTALNEDTIIGRQRAIHVRNDLIESGIESERLTVANYAHTEPILNTGVILSLPNAVEKEAANQKNRRVEVKVVAKTEE